MIKLRVLRWREYPGLSRWVQCKHRYPYKREADRDLTREEKSHAMTEVEGSTVSEREDTMPLAWEMEKEATSQGIQVASKTQKRQGNGLSLKPPGGALTLAL